MTSDKIEEVKVTSDKGEVSTLKKDNGSWQLVAPVAAKADETEASAIANALGQVEIVRVIDENPADLKDYGLAAPRIAIDFKAAGDKDYRRLLIGEKSPTGADLFAKRNDEKKVFLIPAAQESTLNRSTFDLRDKTVLAFERDKVDARQRRRGRKDRAAHQGQRRLEDHAAAAGARRLRQRRRPDRPAADRRHEDDRRRTIRRPPT